MKINPDSEALRISILTANEALLTLSNDLETRLVSMFVFILKLRFLKKVFPVLWWKQSARAGHNFIFQSVKMIIDSKLLVKIHFIVTNRPLVSSRTLNYGDTNLILFF